jgi:hypothetical protein
MGCRRNVIVRPPQIGRPGVNDSRLAVERFSDSTAPEDSLTHETRHRAAMESRDAIQRGCRDDD